MKEAKTGSISGDTVSVQHKLVKRRYFCYSEEYVSFVLLMVD